MFLNGRQGVAAFGALQSFDGALTARQNNRERIAKFVRGDREKFVLHRVGLTHRSRAGARLIGLLLPTRLLQHGASQLRYTRDDCEVPVGEAAKPLRRPGLSYSR